MGIIELSEVTVRRGRSQVLDSWSISVDSGEVVCLSGDNGCGKSTVIETAAGLISMENGSCEISGQLIRDSQGRRGRTNFGLCLQDDCIMGDELVGERILDAAGSEFDITDLLAKWGLSHRIHDKVAMLSGGQRRRVALLSGLVPAMISSKPVAILLDEPDSGLDDESVEKLAETVRDLAAGGHAILISSHDSRIISTADRIIEFPFKEKKGEPASGKFTVIKTNSVRKSYVGHRLNLRTMSGIANNGIAGLLTLGAMLALLEPAILEGRMLTAFILAPALAAGLCGNPIHRLTLENRAFAWWNTKSSIPLNSLSHSLLIYSGLTTLAASVTGEFDVQLILVGGLLGVVTESIVGLLSNATLRLSRPNAVMVRLLTPILLLPWALVVDTLSA
ncbi:MAG: ATP-binding cassette domain-containing protein [Euryarchaeota archaeon]|mgnify:CR=1 FL=1|jgi:ABC-type lipoprotein export system ATPase subunit|nr:ATP-binding cassette domain-containing protein [Euryarchaeota archaeon]MBT5183940.1 ATP-binding cassette domain-containing protein [Euryarchaeota archaeon]